MWWLAVASCARSGPEGLPPDEAELRVLERTFVDPSRPTPELLDLPASAERVLQTWTWLGPSSGEAAPRRPLVLIAHGTEGHPTKFEAFARTLAGAGFVVAAPAFPASSQGSGAGALGVSDLESQPGDLQFVLDELLAAVDDDGDALWRQFDPGHVVAIGHSLGGATVLGWTRFGESPPLDGTVLLSAAEPLTVIFGPSVDAAGPPTLLAHGIDDPLVSYAVSESMYERFEDPSWLLGISGGEHSDPIEDQSEPALPSRDAFERAVIGFVRTYTWGSPGPLDLALAELAVEGHDVRW